MLRKNRWDLSYYTCVMGFTGQVIFEKEKVWANLQVFEKAGVRQIGVNGVNLLEPTACDIPAVVSLFREWLDKFKMQVSSVHYAGPTFAPLDGSQDRVKENLLEHLKLFRLWQPKSFVFHAGWIMGENSTEGVNRGYESETTRYGEETVIAAIAKNFKFLAQKARKYDIKIALENMGGFLRLGQWSNLSRLIALIDEPNVGYCIDSGHAHASGESITEGIRLARSKIFETHFHDNRGLGIDEHLPVGFGTISWIDVILALREIGFPGPVTFEVGGWPIADRVAGYQSAMAWWRACEEIAQTHT